MAAWYRRGCRHLPSAHAFLVGHTCHPSWVFRGNRNQIQFFPPLFFVLLCLGYGQLPWQRATELFLQKAFGQKQ